MNEVKIFIGYQFRSLSLERSEIENLLFEACKKAQKDINQGRQDQVVLRSILFDLLSSKLLFAQILAEVGDSDLCVFEISELCSEALFGIGYALGQGKPCIYLQHEDKDVVSIFPSLPGVFILQFSDQTLSDRLAYEIFRQASKIIDNRTIKHNQIALQIEVRDTIRNFWGLENEHSIYIVCPEIPENERPVYGSPSARDYIRLAKFADIETLFLLKSFLARYFPELQIFECTYKDMPYEANATNLVCIGGIAWNKLTQQITQKINFPFVQRDGGSSNPDPIDDIRTETRYLPTIAPDGNVHEDIGYFVRIPNPANKEKLLFVIT